VSQYFVVHESHPQSRLIRRAAEIVRNGCLVAYPTDTTYALGCHLGDKRTLDRIRQIRRLEKGHLMSLACADLASLSTYARVDNTSYRILKHYTPGPFTFLLPATREVPRRLVHPRRKTIGIRVPANAIAHDLIREVGEPIMTTTLRMPDRGLPLSDPGEIRVLLEHQVDLVIDGGPGGIEGTTVVDLTGAAEVVRQGTGAFA
jgi:tRNA threonylcarbamoyl adenosine modification protein (Sua5/YciO/YrdC/YwlC family)